VNEPPRSSASPKRCVIYIDWKLMSWPNGAGGYDYYQLGPIVSEYPHKNYTVWQHIKAAVPKTDVLEQPQRFP
jgi:hypothetical protein